MSKLFEEGTLPKMLELLKSTFIHPVGSNTVALLDRILSMDDVFEILSRDRLAAFDGLSKIYNLCTGRDFTVTYETDPDFVKNLAQVRMHCKVLILDF